MGSPVTNINSQLFGKVSTDRGTLLDILKSTLEFTSKDHTRLHLNAALFEFIGGDTGQNILRTVTTDGHSLLKLEVVIEGPDDQGIDGHSPKVLVSRDHLERMIKTLRCKKNERGQPASLELGQKHGYRLEVDG